MKIFSKAIAGVIALTMCKGMIPVVSASSIYGDVNNNGIVDLTDLSSLNLYLTGSSSASNINMKYSDVDQNTVIDVNDVKTLRAFFTHSVSSLPHSEGGNTYPNCNSYMVPSDSTRSYVKYDCSTGLQTNYGLNGISSTSVMSGNNDDRQIDSSADAQSIVELSYRKSNGNYYRGSGFIVDNHIIATCAHCIYDGTSFNTDYNIKIYDSDGTTLKRTVAAKELHIPNSYKVSSLSNYDYGLIYVEENLSSYGKIALGTVTNYFTNTSSNVSISGFPAEVSGENVGHTRYYGNGSVKSTSNSYLLETEAYASGGDSGGPMYIEYTLGNETFRSAVGIYRGHYENVPVRYSSGVRITTPVLRFYMDNNNIGS